LTVNETQWAKRRSLLRLRDADENIPEVRRILGHHALPCRVARGQRFGSGTVTDACCMRLQTFLPHADVKAVHTRPKVEAAEHQCVREGGEGHVRLLPEGEAQSERAVCRQRAQEGA
jgi:hypothetical protein